MDQKIEIEFKNLLTYKEFKLVKAYFQLTDNDFMKQRNFYFDTPELELAKQKCALRIREKQGNYELTLKQPFKKHELHETNLSISKQKACSFIKDGLFPETANELRTILASLQVSPNSLMHLGELTTFRSEFAYKCGKLAIDHSFYLGVEDFEIEFEANEKSAGQEIFLQLLKQLGIKKKTTKNKITRFFDEKKRQSM